MKHININFKDLELFITDKMNMTEVYQPLVIKTLLQNGGEASTKQLALAVLPYDQAQIDYYEKIMKRWPKITLTKHGIVTYQRGGIFKLNVDVSSLSPTQTTELIELCNQKIDDFLQAKLKRIQEENVQTPSYISGLLRYQVLAKAKGHCALCGVHKDERALDVDHIVPRNKGGSNDLDNLQALCYKCNRAKRDLDQTDFRQIGKFQPLKSCPFCHVPKRRIVRENPLAIAIFNEDSVTEGHSLILPRQHIQTYFQLTHPEISAVNRVLFEQQKYLSEELQVNEFNISINDGATVGQTSPHTHIHLIPRSPTDTHYSSVEQ